MARRPLILLTNDDGIRSRGLAAAAGVLASLGDLWIVAPEGEQSSCSHSMTLTEPVYLRAIDDHTFAVRGTPGDAAFLAFSDILPARPDLVVSGINSGPNLGKDTFYSGTVAAAREACFRDLRAVAISLVRGDDYSHAARLLGRLALLLAGRGTPFPRGTGPGVLLNVNVPAGKPRGVAWTRLGVREYGDHVVRRTSPRKRVYYWINGGPLPAPSPRGTDVHAIRSGRVSITPLVTDLTDERAYKALRASFPKRVKLDI